MKSSKPAFTKSAAFKGTDAEYTKAILLQASTGVTGGDEFRLAAHFGLRSEDVKTGIAYLAEKNRPKFEKPKAFGGSQSAYTKLVWELADMGAVSGRVFEKFARAGVSSDHAAQAWNYLQKPVLKL